MNSVWVAFLCVVAMVFLMVPVIIAQARHSGRMTTRAEERFWRWYGRLDHRAAEGWRPPRWYPLAVGSASLLWGFAFWSASHEVTALIAGVGLAVGLSTVAVVTRRRTGAGNQQPGDH
jgi:hypothetical protein